MRAKIIILMGLFIGLTSLSWATIADNQGVSITKDSLVSKPIYFRIGSSLIETSFDQNTITLSQLGGILTDTAILSRLDSVLIWATASPDGNTILNQKLATARADAMKQYIVQHYPRIVMKKINTGGDVTPWQQLNDHIQAGVTPYYSTISGILDLGLSPQATEARLRAIDRGNAWGVISRLYLPKMRSGATCVVYTSRPKIQIEETKPAPEPLLEQIRVEPAQIVTQYVVVEKLVETAQKPLFALKTNLLYDAVTAINLEVEIPIGKRWSIAAEYVFPWWLSYRKQLCFQSLSGTIEGKYWFGDRSNRRVLTGWFMGLYTSIGSYDLEWRDKGYQGEFIIPVAISGGYAHQICRNFSMEYSLGVGYMATRYREYRPMVCGAENCHNRGQHLVRQRSGELSWWGPTRLKVSLVWMINTKTRR